MTASLGISKYHHAIIAYKRQYFTSQAIQDNERASFNEISDIMAGHSTATADRHYAVIQDELLPSQDTQWKHVCE